MRALLPTTSVLMFALAMAACDALVPTAIAPTAAPPAAPSTSFSASPDMVVLTMVPGKNIARYRVREQLAGVALPSDAIGSTDQISGTVVAKTDGTIVSTQSKFTVNLSTLKSDQDQRDNFIKRSTLQTDRYPYATFVPTQAPGLPLTLPASGEVSFKLVGDMTIRDVTKSVTWDVQGKVVDNHEATGIATTNFNFAYFNLAIPSVARVLSIVDNIQLELDLDLKRAQ